MIDLKKKPFAVAVALMLCAVAFVGVGYAYIALKDNGGNGTVTKYAVLTILDENGQPTDEPLINGTDIHFETHTVVSGGVPVTTYAVSDLDATPLGGFAKSKTLSTGMHLKLATQGEAAEKKYTLTVTLSAAFPDLGDYGSFVFMIGNQTDTISGTEITFTTEVTAGTYDVLIFIGINDGKTLSDTFSLSNLKISFKATSVDS